MRTDNSIAKSNQAGTNAAMKLKAKEFIASQLGYKSPQERTSIRGTGTKKRKKNRSGKMKRSSKKSSKSQDV